MEIIPLGDSALIVRVREQFEDAPEETLDEVLRAFQLLQHAAIPGVIELAPAYTSVAVFFDPIAVAKVEWHSRTGCLTVRDKNSERDYSCFPASSPPDRSDATPRLIEIPVCYDAEFGLDLDRVAEHTKLSEREVIDLHSTARIPRGLHRVRSRFSISGRVAEEFGDAAPRRTAQRNSSRFGWHRRRANGNLSVAFSGRMEPDRPHSAEAFRSDKKSADASVSRRSRALSRNHAGGV